MIRKFPRKKKNKQLDNDVKSLARSLQILIVAEQKFGMTLLENVKRTSNLYLLYTDLKDLLVEGGIIYETTLSPEDEDSTSIEFTSFSKNKDEDPN